MIVDVHTHLWPDKFTPEEISSYFAGRNNKAFADKLHAESLLSSMDEAGIDLSIVSALPGSRGYDSSKVDQMNRYVLSRCGDSEGRLVPFCIINPLEKGAEKYLEKCIDGDGYAGLKIHCNMQEIYPNDRCLYPFYEIMAEKRKPVLFHCGSIGLLPNKDKYAHPLHFDDVACDFSDLPIILGHSGRIWYRETAMLLRKHENVFADISANMSRCPSAKSYFLKDLLETVKIWTGGTGSVLFGSDYPFYSQQGTRELLDDIFEAGLEDSYLTGDEIKKVFDENAENFCRKYHIA